MLELNKKINMLNGMYKKAIENGEINRSVSIKEDIRREIGDYGLSFRVSLSERNPKAYNQLLRKEKELNSILSLNSSSS